MKALVLFILSLFSVNCLADSANQICRKEAFLYEEKVEIYWNEWSGLAINDSAETSQAEILIRASGKTADFYGILSINCNNAKSFWISAVNYGKPVEASQVVPQEVMMKASVSFCNN